jgi:putative DNA primase/helicase
MESFELLRDLFYRKSILLARNKKAAIREDNGKLEKEIQANEKKTECALKMLGDVSKRAEILKMCCSEGSYLGYAGPWDAEPNLLACTNGVLNLDTLEFREGRPEDNIKTHIPTEWPGHPLADCPVWEKALEDIFEGDSDLINYVQRVLGYCLTGHVKHHYLWIWEGRGRNGKGLIYRIFHAVTGKITAFIDRELLLQHKQGRQSGAPSPDVLALRGKRVAFMVETAEGRKFDAGKMKVLTGGDILTARGLYARGYTEFRPTHKIHLLTNSRPHVSGGDFAA